MVAEKKIQKCIQEILLLSLFKSFFEKNYSKESRQRLRNIYRRSNNHFVTTKNLILNVMHEELSEDETKKIYPLIIAFLNKNSHRKPIPDTVKISLLNTQNYKCAICGNDIDLHAHVDHRVPFKYVGDELKDNYQMLCTTCNLKKNASIDFQIRFLLKSI